MRIPIVNEQDEIIEYKERNSRNPKDIIRATGLWVSDIEGNILLARRSFTKKNHPGKWGPSVSGTVEEGETYESNIIKEAEEEIGLIGLKPVLNKKTRSTVLQLWGQWFSVIVDHNYPFKKQDEEVEEIRWFTKEEVCKLFEEKPEIFTPDFKEAIKLLN